ncbi:MAG TPA: cytochrome P450 [Nocardioides sp.]
MVESTPRRRGIPYLGGTLDYLRDPQRMMSEHYARFGPVSEMDFIGQRWTVLLGPDATSAALRNPEKAFASEPGWGRLVGPFFHGGLMLLDFAEHHRHRRVLQQAFTRQRLEGYLGALGPAVATGLTEWRPGTGFRAYPALKSLTLDIATDIFMGGHELTDDKGMQEVNDAFIACVQAAMGIVRAPLPGTRWGRATAGRAVLEEFLGKHLPLRRAQPGDDLFSALCSLVDDDGTGFTDAEVINHMIFLLMAAHDTTTITVSTILQHLGQSPQWQERCRQESMELPEFPSIDELQGLESLDLVMKESLRMVPPVPVLARKTVAEVEVMGHRIPAGRLTAVMVHHQHHMAEYWDEPERFDPDRFADPRREDLRHRHAWEPFGGGVHKCLGLHFAGLEVKTIVHQLLRRFDWNVDKGYVAPMNYHSLPFPKDGQPINLARLERAAPTGARA